jgi:hypothetical protein
MAEWRNLLCFGLWVAQRFSAAIKLTKNKWQLQPPNRSTLKIVILSEAGHWRSQWYAQSKDLLFAATAATCEKLWTSVQ